MTELDTYYYMPNSCSIAMHPRDVLWVPYFGMMSLENAFALRTDPMNGSLLLSAACFSEIV